jgi:hypothetical protein
MDFQVVLNTFAKDVFRRQADFDYVAARASYRMRLRQQFLWSAQQALEKYLKAILLFNGKSARFPTGGGREFRHNLVALADEVKTIPTFTFSLGSQHDAFLNYLSRQGPNRYVSTTACNTHDVLHQLDGTVWQVRRYCQYFANRGLGSPEPVSGMREASVKAALDPRHKKHPQRFAVSAGELERIVKRPDSDAARQALVWANLYYGAKRRTTVNLPTFSSSEVPPNKRGWTGVNWSAVAQFVKLKPDA